MISILKTVTSTGFLTPCMLSASLPLVVPTKNTFILKRRWPPGLTKRGRRPVLHARHYVYDLVEDTCTKKRQSVDVILTSYVSDVGDIGDIVSVSPHVAYYKLLLGGKAVYATDENKKKYTLDVSKERKKKFSSMTVEKTLKKLSKMVLSVTMNPETEWELQPWHIRASFRKAGVLVPESAIEMPSQGIKGPDLTLQNKEFFVTVTVNDTERIPVACLIHHWNTQRGSFLPAEDDTASKTTEPLFSPPVEGDLK